MRLKSLRLKNFKGTVDFKLTLNSKNAQIRGENGSGKTTLYDATCWLLFDKDSQQSKQFPIKPIDKNNNVVHGIETEVEGVFEAGDEDVTIKKMFSEKWTKPRGQAQKIFSGHTTQYWLDGVPVKLKEFNARTTKLFNEDLFKLITNPLYFSETLPWKKRRDLLLEICGDVSDNDVIGNNPNLEPLKEILGKNSIDDQKKIISETKKALNDEINKIPTRIDEVSLNADIQTDTSTLEKELAAIKNEVGEKEKEVARLKNGEEKIEKENLLRRKEGELLKLRNETTEKKHLEKTAQRELIERKDDNHRKLCRELERLLLSEKNIKNDILQAEGEVAKLREDWNRNSQIEFAAPKRDGVCPACNQKIPETTLAEVAAKASANFNLEKSKGLEKISFEGKEKANEVECLITKLNDQKKLIEESKKLAEVARKDCEIEKDRPPQRDVEGNEKHVKLEDEISNIMTELEGIELSVLPGLGMAESEYAALSEKKWLIESDIVKCEASKKAKERIAFLETEERKLAAELEKAESTLFLLEKFTVAKVEMLESKINSKFELARFRLFNMQINGGVEECCEVLCKGIGFNSALNTGARINVGLDIIKTLQAHYETQAMIFIDNAESVTSFIDMDCQIIKLIADETEYGLTVEKTNG